ncbi:MAG: LysE family translocator [Sphingomonadaceae bacterium]|nr:LysE family translocator [Sphingomonadaceae bacterium]
MTFDAQPTSYLPFVTAAFALLALPGPSNALVANAGVNFGWRAVPMMVASVTLGYAVVILGLILIFGEWLAAHPVIARGLRLACAVYLLFLAVKLWRSRPASDRQAGAFAGELRQVFLVTLLNPKGLVAGLALIPAFAQRSGDNGMPLQLGLLFLAVAAVATALYTAAGGLISMRADASSQRLFAKMSALVVAGFAIYIVMG